MNPRKDATIAEALHFGCLSGGSVHGVRDRPAGPPPRRMRMTRRNTPLPAGKNFQAAALRLANRAAVGNSRMLAAFASRPMRGKAMSRCGPGRNR